MDKQKEIIYILISIILILGISFVYLIFFYSPSTNHSKQNNPRANNNNPLFKNEVKKTPTQGYTLEVPEDIEVPQVGEENKGEIAVPDLQNRAAPGVQAEFRKFSLYLKDSQLIPSKIIVYKGDTIHIELLSKDKNYNFSIPAVYGISKDIIPGEVSIVEFQAYQTGQFDIVCKTCQNKKIGTLIVAPR